MKISSAFVSEHCLSFETIFFVDIFGHLFWSKYLEDSEIFEYKIDHISKTKSRKIDFSFVSDHCTTFWTKRKNSATFEGERVGGLHVVNWDKAHFFMILNIVEGYSDVHFLVTFERALPPLKNRKIPIFILKC